MSNCRRQKHNVDLGDLEPKPRRKSLYVKIMKNENLSLVSGFQSFEMNEVELRSRGGPENGLG